MPVSVHLVWLSECLAIYGEGQFYLKRNRLKYSINTSPEGAGMFHLQYFKHSIEFHYFNLACSY